VDRRLASQALSALAEEMDLDRAMARLPDITPVEWRSLLREAAAALAPPDEACRPTLFVDGASRGNPGPSGAGGVIYQGKKCLGQVSQPLGIMTNNQAEYQALIRGLALARQLGLKALSIKSDSQLMVRQIEGRYRVKDAKLKPLYRQALTALKLLEGYDIIYIERSLNQEADRLANQALDGPGS